MGERPRPLVSFVVPLYNEEACLKQLYARLTSAGAALEGGFEIVAVDDNSHDDTLRMLKGLQAADPRVKVLSFSRNFGHQIAVTAGLRYASGEYVMVLDGDLQDPPELVSEMLKVCRQGFDVVYGVRHNRKESLLLRLCYKMFYRLLQTVSQLAIPLDAGDYCLMTRRVVLEMRRLGEDRPFVRGLRAWVGFKQTGLAYDRDCRGAGDSKYSLVKLFSLAFDGALSFSVNTLRAATGLGMVVSLLSIIYALYTAFNRILIALGVLKPENLIPGWATLVCSVMFLIGLQFIFLGILGEYVGRIFMELKGRPLFVLKEEIGFDAGR